MNREILFRGKRRDNGEWVYGYYVIDRVGEVHRIFSVEDGIIYVVSPDTVGQFTGLPDKNGNKIFEGDILAVCVLPFTHEEKPVTVVFDKNEACFILVIDEKTKSFYRFQDIMESEVIGNIIDTPDLLKGGEE